MVASSRKRELPSNKVVTSKNFNSHQRIDPVNKNKAGDEEEEPVLFVDAPPDSSDDNDIDNDTTDSEEDDDSDMMSDISDDDDSDSEDITDDSESEDSETENLNEGETSVAGTSSSEPTKINEYEYDSSDEEDLRNTVGNIPMEWYRDYPHIGYDLAGRKILKPQTGDELDNLIDMSENPDYWRTVRDPQTGQNIVLSREDCEIIQNLKSGKFADKDVDPYTDWPDSFEREVSIHPVSNRPEDKRSFIPSKWERLKVGKMVHSMKMGWMKLPSQVKKEKEERKHEDEEDKVYDLWSKEEENDKSRLKMHIPAPKTALPGHAESYNPPPEYLFSKEELEKWRDTEPEDRRQNFVPHRYPSMRLIPAYSRFVNERFERCLDLYLCPRQQKMRMNVNPEDLIPKLPQPKDLQPFPTTESLVFKGHTDLVRKISISPSGQWMVSGSDDKTIKLWETRNGRCLKTMELDDKIKCVAWCPNPNKVLIAVACGNDVLLINPQLADKLAVAQTDAMLSESSDPEKPAGSAADWQDYIDESPEFTEKNIRIKIKHSKVVTQVTWHCKGDYLAVTLNDAGNQSVMIHQISKRRSQCPFSKPKGLVQCTLFHPTKPFLFVATQRYVRVYNLLKQELARKLQANCKWISSMAIHPSGDNIITGSYDCRLHWFDMDLSTKPYQTLKHQKKAIRSVDFHKKYPLFASTSDDGSIVVCHGMVYNDLMQNPLIVPVKVLKGHVNTNGLSAIDCQFHPGQPWLLTSGADSTIRLFS